MEAIGWLAVLYVLCCDVAFFLMLFFPNVLVALAYYINNVPL